MLPLRKQSQKEKILAYLKEGNSIEPLTALRRFGCFRLAAIVHALNKEGYLICSEMVYDETSGKHWAKYYLQKFPG